MLFEVIPDENTGELDFVDDEDADYDDLIATKIYIEGISHIDATMEFPIESLNREGEIYKGVGIDFSAKCRPIIIFSQRFWQLFESDLFDCGDVFQAINIHSRLKYFGMRVKAVETACTIIEKNNQTIYDFSTSDKLGNSLFLDKNMSDLLLYCTLDFKTKFETHELTGITFKDPKRVVPKKKKVKLP